MCVCDGVRLQSAHDGDLDMTLSADVGGLGFERSEAVGLIRRGMEEMWMGRTQSGCIGCWCRGVA
jgi:hypothetical protein